MKITKKQLKKIIREEKQKILIERGSGDLNMVAPEFRDFLNEYDMLVYEFGDVIYAAQRNGLNKQDKKAFQAIESKFQDFYSKLVGHLIDVKKKGGNFRKVVDRRPTDADGYT